LTKTVDLLPDANCFEPFDVWSGAALFARGFVERSLGRPVHDFAASYEVDTLTLPTGMVKSRKSPPVPPGLDPAVYSAAIHFSPGGLVDIDPERVVPRERAEEYEVLPEYMGLAQLVASGALENHDGAFFIVRPIPRFPAGLYGALRVRFVLGRGLPMPAGSPCHSCVISEETGLALTNLCP
jgi:hypothetical protein